MANDVSARNTSLATEPKAPHLRRDALGTGSIVFMVVAAAAPLTAIAGAVPVAIALGNGPGLPAAYLFAAVVLLLFAVGYAAMSRHVTNAGAFYAYVTHGLGRPFGLAAAFLALLSYTAIQAAVFGLFGATAAGFVAEKTGMVLPWWAYVAVAMALVGLLGYRKVDLSARVLGVLLLCEVGIIAVLDVGVILAGGAAGLSAEPLTPSAFFSGSPGIAVMFAFASFIGFEATAIYGEEARNPKRTVPRATYAAVVLIGGFYALSAWAIVNAYGVGEVAGAAAEDPQGLVLAAAGTYVGAVAVDVMVVLLLTSLFACALAFHNAVARYLFALGREGVFPAALGRSHARHDSPYVGSLVQIASAVVLVGGFALAGLDPVLALFSWMAGVGTEGILVLQALTCVAVIAFFRRTRLDTRRWHTLVAPALGLAGMLFALSLVVRNFTTLIGGSVGVAVLLQLVVLGATLAGVAVALKWRRARHPRYERLGAFLD